MDLVGVIRDGGTVVFRFHEGDLLYHTRKIYKLFKHAGGRPDWLILNLPPSVSPYTFPHETPNNKEVDAAASHKEFLRYVDRGLNGGEHLTLVQYSFYMLRLLGIVKAFAELDTEFFTRVLITGFPLDAAYAGTVFAAHGFYPDKLFIWQRRKIEGVPESTPLYAVPSVFTAGVHKDGMYLPPIYYALSFTYDGKERPDYDPSVLYPAKIVEYFLDGEYPTGDFIPREIVNRMLAYFRVRHAEGVIELYPGRGCISEYYIGGKTTYFAVEPRMDYAYEWKGRIIRRAHRVDDTVLVDDYYGEVDR